VVRAVALSGRVDDWRALDRTRLEKGDIRHRWIGATLISFPLAILEQRGEIESREILDDLMSD
jgi:hypothetical protein